MDENWKTVEDFPDYAVSDLGRVKRLTTRTCAKAGAILKACGRSKKRPYLSVDLCRDGKRRTVFVHRLVALAFLPPPPFDGAEVNHCDGDKRNPALSNLEWETSSGNQIHAYATGLATAVGEANGQAKLTEADVLDIRSASTGSRGEAVAFAVAYGVSGATVRDALSRRTWAHL